MVQPPAEIEQAARQAAEQVRIELIAMLMAGELGEVAAVVGFNQLQVEPRIHRKLKPVKLARGRWALIEPLR